MSRMPENWTPPYPAFDADLPPQVKSAVCGYFGSQGPQDQAAEFITWFLDAASDRSGPEAVERAHFIDRSGYRNEFFVGYWTDPTRYARWEDSDRFRSWWNDSRRLREPNGIWREVMHTPRERFEISLSGMFKPGLAARAVGHKIEQRHAYWGSARDRIAASQADTLTSSFGPELLAPVERASFGKRLRVTCPQNLCCIRSGQDWTELTGEHRSDYLEVMAPVLHEGMRFIRDNAVATGCCSNRFAEFTDLKGARLDRTAGIAHFLTLGHLERWAEHHPTHLAIFGTVMKLMKKFDFQMPLQLWHEVFILPADRQLFEYVNCHPFTGLLPWFEASELS